MKITLPNELIADELDPAILSELESIDDSMSGLSVIASTYINHVNTTHDKLDEIIRQLKITNLHLSLLTNEEISNVD
jgi:hypothetical protein